jgi:HEAT repeat protein
MKRRLLVLCIVLAGCQASPEEPISTRNGTLVEPSEPPADAAAIAGLLRARHVEDLPSAEDLAKYPTAEASLRHLALAGSSMVVRTRALMLLQHFGSEETGALLEGIVRDPDSHPALRAAAVNGLAGQPLDDRAELRALVVGALHDTDPRVGLAAVDTLGRSPKGRYELGHALKRADLPKPVRAAIEAR